MPNQLANTYRSTMHFYLGQLMQPRATRAKRELWKNKILDFALSVDPGKEAKQICESRKRDGLMD